MNDWKTTVPGAISALAIAAKQFMGPEYVGILDGVSALGLGLLAYFAASAKKQK